MIAIDIYPLFQRTYLLLFTLSSLHQTLGAPQAAQISYSVSTYRGPLNSEFYYLASEIGAAELKSATSGSNKSSATTSGSNNPSAATFSSNNSSTTTSSTVPLIASQLTPSSISASGFSKILGPSAAALPTQSTNAAATSSTSSASIAKQKEYSLASSSTVTRFVAAPTAQVIPTSLLNPSSRGSSGDASAVGNASAVVLPAPFSASPSSLSGGGILLFLGSITNGFATEQGPSSTAGMLPTITTLPPGMSIQTITKTKCSTFGAMATATAAGSTVTQDVLRLCDNGFAFLIFGLRLPRVGPLLCHNRWSILGFLLDLLCSPGGLKPDGIRIIGAPPYTPSLEGSFDPLDPPPPYTPSPDGPPANPDDPDNPDGPENPDNPHNPDDPDESDDEPTNTDSQPSHTKSRPSLITSSASQPSRTNSLPSSVTSKARQTSSTVSSAPCTNTMSGGCCSNATVITLSGIGPSTICNFAIDTWVEVAYDFVTGSISIPPSATPISMPAVPVTATDADVLFSFLASTMSAYLSSIASLSKSNTANSAVAASSIVAKSSTAQPTPTVWIMTTVSGYGFCTSGYATAGLSKYTIGASTSSWCATSGAIIPTAAIAPGDRVVIPTDPPSSSVAPAAPSPTQPNPTSRPAAAPSPTPSVGSLEFWREDTCDDTGCSSTIYGWEIGLAPVNQVINPCKNSKYNYNYDFPASVANDNSNYTITMKGISALGLKGLEYLGSNDGYHESSETFTGWLFPSDGDTSIKTIFCNPVPGAMATSCSDAHSLDENNWTPVGYCPR